MKAVEPSSHKSGDSSAIQHNPYQYVHDLRNNNECILQFIRKLIDGCLNVFKHFFYNIRPASISVQKSIKLIPVNIDIFLVRLFT